MFSNLIEYCKEFFPEAYERVYLKGEGISNVQIEIEERILP